MNTICPVCREPIKPGEPRISYFARDENGFVDHDTEGSIHVSCFLMRAS